MRSKGLALVAVLWLVAALSIVVTGLLGTVRLETRTVGVQKERVAVAAEADAAILLTLQALEASKQEQWDRPQTWRRSFEGNEWDVTLTPASGWIDINTAPSSLLAGLFQHAGGLDATPATQLAQAVVAYREREVAGQRRLFEAVDDMAALPEMPFDVYVRIRHLATVHGGSAAAGKVNPLAAPAPVLQVLAEGNPQILAALVSAQSASSPTTDMTMLDPQHVQVSSGTRVRLAVSAGAYQRQWWVQLGGGRGPTPWRVLARETVALAAAD